MTEFRYTLRDAFIEAEKIRLSQIPSNSDINWIPSAKFEKKVQKLIKHSKRDYWYLINTSFKRAAVIVATILVLLGFSMSIKAIREPVVRFIIETYEKYTNIFFGNDDTDLNLPRTIEQKYTITAIPEGYTFLSMEEMPLNRKLIWRNKDNEEIIFNQGVLYNANMTIDTEDSSYEYVMVDSYNAIYLTKWNMQIIIWENGIYKFSINCSTSISYEELIHIAESLTEEK
ncbi:MAG TPA: DUF4367 domain-containing protein [Clostridia bacterium]|nr:DUF4367 domain-containing protein [Clostridia bacterium]HPB16410.1 DUF4367 domain-containing protein [Clostridia bacterium]HQM96017.1 DUF4367 domain-containing protein [Clostridia bacterium]